MNIENKESGDPYSRAGARPLKRPYFLSAKCAYPIKRGTLSPGGFCFVGRIFYETKKEPSGSPNVFKYFCPYLVL